MRESSSDDDGWNRVEVEEEEEGEDDSTDFEGKNEGFSAKDCFSSVGRGADKNVRQNLFE